MRDGLGIKLLQQTGLQIAYQWGKRCHREPASWIQHCMVGVKDKLKVLDGLQKELNIARHTVFIGDDLND